MSSDAQYERDENLATRIAFHERFTKPYVDFSRWVFDRIPFGKAPRVLEIGCGNGEFWVQNKNRLPEGMQLILTDSSSGMVEQARRRLTQAGITASFETVSADRLPFEDDAFDIIIAKHMLYHVDERDVALAEARRCLAQGGGFCASTNSASYMKELFGLLGEQGNLWMMGQAARFTLENGAEQLSRHFAEVSTVTLEGELRVTDPEAVVAYINSLSSLYDEPENTSGAAQRARSKVADEIERSGDFRIRKCAGLFLCR